MPLQPVKGSFLILEVLVLGFFNRFFVTHFTSIFKHAFAVHSCKLIQFRHPIFHVHRCAFLGFNFSKVKKGGHQTIQPKEFVFGKVILAVEISCLDGIAPAKVVSPIKSISASARTKMSSAAV